MLWSPYFTSAMSATKEYKYFSNYAQKNVLPKCKS